VLAHVGSAGRSPVRVLPVTSGASIGGQALEGANGFLVRDESGHDGPTLEGSSKGIGSY
jgi:hypothetical protein